MANNRHLTLDQRIQIEKMLGERSAFSHIARSLDKHPSTISLEVRNHCISEKAGTSRIAYNACIHRYTCKIPRLFLCRPCNSAKKVKLCKNCGMCNAFCDKFEKDECRKLQKAPYVCNGCPVRPHCTLEKKFYRAETAHSDYKKMLSESRTGISVSEEELERLEKVMAPLIRQKQSVHHICVHNSDEIMISERTLYRLIENGFFSFRNVDLPRKVRRRLRKKKRVFKVDRACRIGREWKSYLKKLEEEPDIPVVQMDSVEGKKGGAVLLTIHFVKAELMLAFYREYNDSRSVTDIFNDLYRRLGKDDFKKIFPLLLADNGSEFSNPKAIEFTEDGERRTFVYYCDPNASQQKGSAERNHEFIRYFLPKGKDFTGYEQKHISLMMDHINSYSRGSLGDKTPYEVFEFLYGREILDKLGCHRIQPNDVTLDSSIFKEVDKSDL